MSLDSPIAIKAEDLTRRFGDFTAVDRLNLSVPKASIYGFLGPNGCGKSTTIRMLCGLLSPSDGRVNVLGMDVPQESEQLRLRIGYMTQRFSLYEDLTAVENLRFMGQIYRIETRQLNSRIQELLARYSLQAIAKQRAGSMSGGQRQRLALAAATLHKPDLLLLDEPTSAVDPENRRNFWEKLFDLCDAGTTILVSTHYMDEAERCHRLAILESGQLRAEGVPQQLMESMGATVVEVDAENLRYLKTKIEALPMVKSTAQQGRRLRVLVNSAVAEPENYLHQHLQQENLQTGCVHPSLEDVFVTVTGEGRQ